MVLGQIWFLLGVAFSAFLLPHQNKDQKEKCPLQF